MQRSLALAIVLASSAAHAQAPDAPPPPAQAPADEPAQRAPEEEPAAAPSPMPVGRVTGKIADAATEEGLPAAGLTFKGEAQHSITTELDGTFAIELPAGTYTVEISTPEYGEEHRTIVVAADGALTLDVSLAMVPTAAKGETVEVFDTIDTHKASAVLAERRAAATVNDAISSEQISRSPDSNASDAAKRMVAATIQDNRYIVIRGLGGRYSLTLLNGVPLPSPDPDVPAAPLDLFPAALITNLTVTKTASPDLPASFAGGVLGIETRSYPTKFTFTAKVGVANNSSTSFRGINGQAGSGLDALGFDDGGRALPASIPGNKLAGDPSLSAEQRNAQLAAFSDNWQIAHRTAGPNLGLAATLGDTLRIGGERVGYFTSVSFGHGYAHRIAHIARVGGDDGMGGRLPSVMQLRDETGIEQANLGAIASAGWSRPGQKVDAFGLYSHTADISASQVTGTENNASVVDRTRLQFLQRELAFAQLLGEHKLAPKAILEWQGNVARVAQHEPDTRDLLRTQTTDGRYAISGGSGAAERTFGELADTTLGGGAAVRVPLDGITLKLGTSISHSARDYQQRRFHFDVRGDAAYEDPNAAFAPDNAGTQMSMYEATVPTDGYQATRTVFAGYTMADWNVTPALRLVGGARYEMANLDVSLASKIDLMVPPTPATTHDDNDVLPALNAVYALSSTMLLRAAYGMTVARPNFREIAPALYYDYVRRRAIGGNPDLVETKIHNADLRWEQYLGDSEVIAMSLFGKHFTQPIERTVEDAGDGQNIGFANTPSADTYGVELEARLSLGRLVAALDEFSVGANISLIGSRIDVIGATRALQGQSPYVANVGLGYESHAVKTRVDLLFNSFGRRIEEVGSGGSGNVYEEPFHRLDLALSQPLAHQVRLKLAGSNLLNRRVVRTQDDVEIFSYTVGVTVVGSAEMTLD